MRTDFYSQSLDISPDAVMTMAPVWKVLGFEVGFLRYLTRPIKVNEPIEPLNVALEFAEKRLGRTRNPGQLP